MFKNAASIPSLHLVWEVPHPFPPGESPRVDLAGLRTPWCPPGRVGGDQGEGGLGDFA